jgi:glycosyltransferase involved in cell wall biosynthesis
MVLKKGDHFIVHSKEDIENLKEMIPNADVRENFHPTYEIFHHGSVTKEKAQRQIGISGNTLLFFGFVRPYKGLKYLIDAMPIINKHLDINLLIVGEFWEGVDEYRRQIEGLGVEKTIIILNRYVPNEEVELYFAASDVVVLPYISATGSGIVQAAFGCNKPVITTTVGCLSDVVDHGKTGYLVPPKSPQAIADAVLSFYKNGRHDEFVNSIVKDKKKFSWDRMVETIEGFQ